MIKKILFYFLLGTFLLGTAGCKDTNKNKEKIGVSFGVGEAIRWQKEKAFMEKRAGELGVEIEARLNTKDKPKTQEEDCIELIDSGVSVLIVTPRNVKNMSKVVKYAQKNNVKVIAYARVITGEDIDLYVGYDSKRIGQMQGQYLAEMVDKGNYILLKGDKNDENANLLYEGALPQVKSLKNNVNIILDASVPNWSPKEAKELVMEAVKASDNKVDAILAPNDKIAESCVEVLEELKIDNHVVITGMDAEIGAIKRILQDKQDMTIHMDLQELAYTTIDEAVNMIKGRPVITNAESNNESGKSIPSNLIIGRLITKQNIDRILIENNIFTKEEVYGK